MTIRGPRGIARIAHVGVSPIEGEGGRVLMSPGCRNRLGLQGLEGHGPKDLLEIGGTQRLENLSQARIMN
jgi:hypothetical protein